MPPDLIVSTVSIVSLVVNLMMLGLVVVVITAVRRELRNAFHKSFLPVIIKHIHQVERICIMNAQQLADLKAAAAKETAVSTSVVALLTTLAQQLHDANNNVENPNPEVQAIIDGMNARATDLASAVAVNTPVASNPDASGSAPPASDLPPSTGDAGGNAGTSPGASVPPVADVTNDDGSVTHADGTISMPNGDLKLTNGDVQHSDGTTTRADGHVVNTATGEAV